MALNFVHPPEVFDLSSLARALDDVAARTHALIYEPMDIDVVPPPPPVQYMDLDPTPWPAELDLQPWCIVPTRPLVHTQVWDVSRTKRPTGGPKPTEEPPAWAVVLPDLSKATPTFDRAVSSRKAEKAPVRDVPPEVAVEAVPEEVPEVHTPPSRIDMTNMASSSKVKLEDMLPCVGVIRPSKPIDRPPQITLKNAIETRPDEQQVNGTTYTDQLVANVIQNEVLDVEMIETEISFVSVDIVQPQIPFQVTTFPTLNPVTQLSINETFLRFDQETPHQAVDAHLRMTTGVLNHNIDNDFVMFEDDYVDYSHLPTEYMDLDFPLSIVSSPGHDSPGHMQPLAMECDPCESPVSPVRSDEGQPSEQQTDNQEFVAEQEEMAQDEPDTCSSETEESGTAENGEGQAEEDGERPGEGQAEEDGERHGEGQAEEDGERQGEERDEDEEGEEEESEEERRARVAQLLTEIFGDGEDSDDEEEDQHQIMGNMDTALDHCSVTSEDSSSGDSHSMSSDATTETTVEDPSLYTDGEGDRLIAPNADRFIEMDAPCLSSQEDMVQDMGCIMDKEVIAQNSREESGAEDDENWEEYEGEEEEEEYQPEYHAQLLEDIFGDDEEDEQLETEEEEREDQPQVKAPPKVAPTTVTRDPRLRRKG